jgi:hypothetical protein
MNFRLRTAWTVKIGEGSGPQDLILGDLGSGPRFPVVDPVVNYQGPLPSPILTLQALQV